MIGQHFHPSEFDLSEAEVALNLHKVTLGTNKTRVWGVITVPLNCLLFPDFVSSCGHCKYKDSSKRPLVLKTLGVRATFA